LHRKKSFMLRNLAYHTLTLLASLIILAHAVIPHHHHSDGVCFDFAVYVDPQYPGHHHNHADCCENDHHTDHTQEEKQQIPSNHQGSDCCYLAEMLVFHPAPQRTELSCPVYDIQCNDYTSLPYLNTAKQLALGPLPANLRLRHKQVFTEHPMESAATIPGLRAPPACHIS
jgi:hypothetical protein